MTDTTEPRSITDLRRALIAEYEDCGERRQQHRAGMKNPDDQAAFDAYEGLVGAGTYAWLIAGILRLLEERHPETAATVAEWVELSQDSGVDWLKSLNSDLDNEPAATAMHEHSYPINPPGGSFAYPGDCACGSPYSDVEEEAQQREIAAIEWAVHVEGLGVLARQDNNPNSPLFTEETAQQYAAWANTEMAWIQRGEANSAVVLHYGVPVPAEAAAR